MTRFAPGPCQIRPGWRRVAAGIQLSV